MSQTIQTQNGELQNRRRTRNVSRFISNRAKNTQSAYKKSICRFISWVFNEPSIHRIGENAKAPFDIEHYDRLAIEYLNDGRDEFDFIDDITDFLRSNSHLAPKTLSVFKSAIVSWLAENHVYLNERMLKRVKTGNYSLGRDRIFTIEELRRILNHCDSQMRTLIVILASSGLRISESLLIEWNDINFERGSINLKKDYCKNRQPRIVFFSEEAHEMLQSWKEYHPAFLEKVDAYSPPGFERNTNLVFPIKYSSVREKYSRALEKAGLDERDPDTGWSTLRIHTLRKFFRTRLPQGGCSIDVVEALLGHSGYLSNAYVRLETDELERSYRESEHKLWIFKEPGINEDELRLVEAENTRLKNEAELMKKDIEMLVSDYTRLKDNFDRLYQDDGVMIDSIESMVRKVIAEQT